MSVQPRATVASVTVAKVGAVDRGEVVAVERKLENLALEVHGAANTVTGAPARAAELGGGGLVLCVRVQTVRHVSGGR